MPEDRLQNRTGRNEAWTLNKIPLGRAYSAYNKMALDVTAKGVRFMDEASYISLSQKIEENSFPIGAVRGIMRALRQAATMSSERLRNSSPPVSTAPFYAIDLHNATFGTCGGLDVDASMRVLENDHSTLIEGLYAIGNDSLGVIHNPNRHYAGFGGVAQSWLWTGGLIAGEHAADYVADTFGCSEISVALSDLPSSF